MKKLIAVLLAAAMCFAFCACGGNDIEPNYNDVDVDGLEALRIGISSGEDVPQFEILDSIYSRVAAKGYRLELVPFDSAEEANAALAAKEIDANLINQKWQFDQYNEANPDVLLNLGPVYYAPYGLYLCNFEKTEDITDGAKIAVPSDDEGMARALLLLEQLEYISVNDEAGLNAKIEDIEENSREFEFVVQSADEIAENIETGEADVVVMSSDSVKAAGYELNKKAVAVEDYTGEAAVRYSTVFAINKEDISSQKYKTVGILYFSPLIYETTDGFTGGYVVPSFLPKTDR